MMAMRRAFDKICSIFRSLRRPIAREALMFQRERERERERV
jgi:hypothetical protein